LSKESLPSFAREIDVGFARVRAARMSYAGGPGVELYVPIEMARHVHWLCTKRADLASDAGYYAIDALRIEAGRRAWGANSAPTKHRTKPPWHSPSSSTSLPTSSANPPS
jgi:4-methylaminobutanoate oxidase (formaldehyde-forming)